MYFVAKLHPHLPHTEQIDYQGPWLSHKDKKRLVKRFYEENLHIPICIDHKGTHPLGYVKQGHTVGKVLDLFVDKNGELMVKAKLDPEHKSHKEVNQSIFRDKQRWGVSVGLVTIKDEAGNVKARNLAHMALTTDPGFAKEGTYIYDWYTNEEVLDACIVKKYCSSEACTPNQPPDNSFAMPQFRKKLKESCDSTTVALYRHIRMNQNPQQQQQQQQPHQEEEEMMEEEQQQPVPQKQPLKRKEAPSQFSLNLDGGPTTNSSTTKTGPDNLITLRKQINEKRKYLKDNQIGLEDMDEEFQEEYILLINSLKKEEKEMTSYFQRLKNEGACTPELTNQWCGILTSKDPAASDGQQTMIALAAANRTLLTKAEEELALLRREKEDYQSQLQQQQQPQQLQQQSKKVKTNTYTSPVPQQQQQKVSSPQQQQQQQKGVSNLLEPTGKVFGQTQANKAYVKDFVNPRTLAYQPPTDYTVNAGEKTMYDQLSFLANQYRGNSYSQYPTYSS